MKITLNELKALIRETYGGGSREATAEEIEQLDRLRQIYQGRKPGQSIETRLDKLEAKVDAILDMLGEM